MPFFFFNSACNLMAVFLPFVCAVYRARMTLLTSCFRLPANSALIRLSECKLIDIDEEDEIDIVL